MQDFTRHAQAALWSQSNVIKKHSNKNSSSTTLSPYLLGQNYHGIKTSVTTSAQMLAQQVSSAVNTGQQATHKKKWTQNQHKKRQYLKSEGDISISQDKLLLISKSPLFNTNNKHSNRDSNIKLLQSNVQLSAHFILFLRA